MSARLPLLAQSLIKANIDLVGDCAYPSVRIATPSLRYCSADEKPDEQKDEKKDSPAAAASSDDKGKDKEEKKDSPDAAAPSDDKDKVAEPEWQGRGRGRRHIFLTRLNAAPAKEDEKKDEKQDEKKDEKERVKEKALRISHCVKEMARKASEE